MLLTLKVTTAQVVETSVIVNNIPIQDYVHPDDQTQPFDILFSCNLDLLLGVTSVTGENFNEDLASNQCLP